jgi:hypothetical protein
MARTSMHSLLFTVPKDPYPFNKTVTVRWAADVYEFRFEERLRMAEWLNPLVAADRCFAGNAPVVLDAFLYQLAGAAAPA